jgi:D-alanyl-D-alanine dipeptidase
MENKITIQDNKEPLVDIKKYCPGIKIRLSNAFLKKEGTAFVRLGVAKKLHQAQKLLPRGINFVINDAWRPAYIQAKIYFWYFTKSKRLFPKISGNKLKKQIEKFVAPWKGMRASGHMTGGAIDVRLINKNGKRLPMVSKKLSYKENCLPIQNKLPEYLKRNRKIMVDALSAVGLSNNVHEYWHWSYGDYYWAKRTGKSKTIYGVINDNKNIFYNKLCPCGLGKKFHNCCEK